MSARSAVARIDWPKLASALSLTPATASALTAFRKRNVDAHNKLNQLKASRTDVDFAYYRGVLKNTKVIDEIEKAARSFKPVTYDVSGVLKGIETFEGEAVKSAQETERKISEQMKDLEETVKNIEQARNPEELSVSPSSFWLLMAVGRFTQDDPGFASKDATNGAGWHLDGTHPDSDDSDLQPPGYREKFGDLTIM